MVEITDVQEAEYEVTRLKANGHQMMLEEVALEVLADILRSDSVEEMVRNAHGRLMPEWDEDRWQEFFEYHAQKTHAIS